MRILYSAKSLAKVKLNSTQHVTEFHLTRRRHTAERLRKPSVRCHAVKYSLLVNEGLRCVEFYHESFIKDHYPVIQKREENVSIENTPLNSMTH